MIPKLIHQIWIGPNKEPTKWTNTIKNDYIQAYPDYEYKLWNESNIDELFTEFPNIKIVYNLEKTWHGKSDILRYLILYHYGGIYIDADSVWLNNKNFDDLINKCCGFFAAKENSGTIVNGVIGSYKNNKIFIKILKHIEGMIINKDGKITNRSKQYYIDKILHAGVSKVIGPGLFNRYVKDEEITIFPTHYFYPKCWHGITDSDYHLKNEINEESFLFQYGYTTNNFEKKI